MNKHALTFLTRWRTISRVLARVRPHTLNHRKDD